MNVKTDWGRIGGHIQDIIREFPDDSTTKWLELAVEKGLVAENMPITTFRNGIRERTGLNIAEERRLGRTETGPDPKRLYQSLAAENNLLRKRIERREDIAALVVQTVESLGAEILYPAPKQVGLPSKKKSAKGMDPEEMCATLGDVHWGKKQDKAVTIGMGEYNEEVARERLDLYFDRLERIYNIHSTYLEIPRLNMFCLGDLVDGDSIFSGHRFYVFEAVVEQCFNLASLLATKLTYLSQTIPDIWVYCVMGNHGRPQKQPGENYYKTNFDYILYKVLSLALQNNPNIHIVTSESRIMGLHRQGFSFLINHGDDINSFYRVPFYGMDDAANRWTTTMREFWDYILLGHFHQGASFDVSYSEVLVNGSFVGADEFALRKLKRASAPKQLVFGLHEKHGITWRYQIQLSDERGFQGVEPDDLGILTPNDGGVPLPNMEQ